MGGDGFQHLPSEQMRLGVGDSLRLRLVDAKVCGVLRRCDGVCRPDGMFMVGTTVEGSCFSAEGGQQVHPVGNSGTSDR